MTDQIQKHEWVPDNDWTSRCRHCGLIKLKGCKGGKTEYRKPITPINWVTHTPKCITRTQKEGDKS